MREKYESIRKRSDKTPSQYAEQLMRLAKKTGVLELCYVPPRKITEEMVDGVDKRTLRKILKLILNYDSSTLSLFDKYGEDKSVWVFLGLFEPLMEDVMQELQVPLSRLGVTGEANLRFRKIIAGAVAGKGSIVSGIIYKPGESMFDYFGFAGTFDSRFLSCRGVFNVCNMWFSENTDAFYRGSAFGMSFLGSDNKGTSFSRTRIFGQAFRFSNNGDSSFKGAIISGAAFHKSINTGNAFFEAQTKSLRAFWRSQNTPGTRKNITGTMSVSGRIIFRLLSSDIIGR